jgi:CubicO group peptidase (beta-lactamase class C family)
VILPAFGDAGVGPAIFIISFRWRRVFFRVFAPPAGKRRLKMDRFCDTIQDKRKFHAENGLRQSRRLCRRGADRRNEPLCGRAKTTAQRQKEPKMDFTELKNFMKRLTDRGIPGNAVVIYEKGREIFRWQTGLAELAAGREMTPDIPINIYSCTKVATVTAGMQLLERGEILLSDPLYAYLPAFREMQVKTPDGALVPAGNPITIQNLFTMTAGFNYDLDSPAFRRARQLTQGRMDTRTAVNCLAGEPLSFEPGAHWQYSLCHDVLAAVVETVSGLRFSDYVNKNIFAPLEMKNSFFHRTPELLSRMAAQYRWVTAEMSDDPAAMQSGAAGNGEGRLEQTDKRCEYELGPDYDSGGAGIVTTVADYALLIDALANGGLGYNGNRILSEAAVHLLHTNQLSDVQLKDFHDWPQLAGYGYGLGVRTMMDRAAGGALSPAGEFGWGGAAGATALADPERGLGVFYAHHMLNPQETYYQPRLRNVIYSCLSR